MLIYVELVAEWLAFQLSVALMVMAEAVVRQRSYQGREQERQEEEEWKRQMTTRNLN